MKKLIFFDTFFYQEKKVWIVSRQKNEELGQAKKEDPNRKIKIDMLPHQGRMHCTATTGGEPIFYHTDHKINLTVNHILSSGHGYKNATTDSPILILFF